LPDGRTGLVSSEASGTRSVVDLQTAVKVDDVTVDCASARAYVALSALEHERGPAATIAPG